MHSSRSRRSDVLRAASAREWHRVEELLPQLDAPIDMDPDLALAAGLALTALGSEPFDAARLSAGVRYLEAAWERGKRDSDVFWQLVNAQYSLGKQADAAAIAYHYVAETRDPNERVRVGAFLAQVREVLGQYDEALNAHRACLTGLGEKADVAAKLDSYLNGHVAAAYGRQEASREWVEHALQLWRAAPNDVKTLEKAEHLLMDAILAVDADKGEHGTEARRIAVTYAEELLADSRLVEGADRLTALAAKGRLFAHMLWLYSIAGLGSKAQAALDTARAVADHLMEGADLPDVGGSSWQDAAFTILHNTGLLCRRLKRKEQALTLLRKAEQVAPRPFGPTFYALAALVLETGGDRKESLHYLQRIAEDKEWAYGGLCVRPQEEFFGDAAFESVRDDPEFLAVVNSLRKQAST